MKPKVVEVKDSTGNVRWVYGYSNMDEMFADLKVILKPSLFGTEQFTITIMNSQISR